MSEIRRLAKFAITEVEDGYRVQITDDKGAVVELAASEAELDQIIDELDLVLGEFDDGEV